MIRSFHSDDRCACCTVTLSDGLSQIGVLMSGVNPGRWVQRISIMVHQLSFELKSIPFYNSSLL